MGIFTEWSPWSGFLDKFTDYWEKEQVSTPSLQLEVIHPTVSTVFGYRVVIAFKRFSLTNGGSGWTTPDEDAALCNLHLVNYTGGDLDSTWTPADFAAAEARLLTFFNTMKAYTTAHHRIYRLYWYAYGDGIASGPPARITDVNIDGTASGTALPYQCATVLTLRTAVPRHRGRIYWPGLTAAELEIEGQLSLTYTTNFLNAWNALLSGLYADDLPIIVWDRAHGAIQSVTSGHVDSIVDIQRRRRANTIAHQSTLP